MAGKKLKTALNDSQLISALVKSLLERSAEVVGDTLPTNAEDIRAGTYPVNVTIKINGDLIKGEAYRNDDKFGPSFSNDELLTALLYGMSTTEVEEKIHDAVENIIHARENVGAKATMAKAEELLVGVVKSYCESRGQWKIKPGKLNRGPTTGKPCVTVAGTIGVNKTSLGVKLTVDANTPARKTTKKAKGKKAA